MIDLNPPSALGTKRAPGVPSEFVEKYLEWDNEPVSFKKYPFMISPLNDGAEFRLMVWARQVGKTFTMAADVIASTSIVPRTSVVFVSSAMENAKIFHNQKLKVMMESPRWRTDYYDEGYEDAILYKRLRNGSDVILRGGFGSGGRIRGISAGNLYIDELQDVERELVETAESVMTRAKIKRMMMGGTQSNLESSVNHYWDLSDRKEWMIICSHCGKWSDEIGLANIGKKGLICGHCGGIYNLHADRAEWVTTGSRNASISAYRFPLPCLAEIEWRLVLQKLEKLSPRMFAIDVLAQPFDFSSKPISMTELRAMCDESYTAWVPPSECRGHQLYAGVDFGHNLGSTTQVAVLKADAYGKLKLVFMKKLVGFEAEPKHAKEVVASIFERYGVSVLAGDNGGQWETMPWLIERFGGQKIHAIQSVGTQDQTIQFNKKGGFWTISKVQMLNHTFMAMKTGKFVFPNWSLFSPFGTEVLNEYLVFDEDSQRARYGHPPEHPDDSLSAIALALVASKIATGEYQKLPVRGIGGPMFSAG